MRYGPRRSMPPTTMTGWWRESTTPASGTLTSWNDLSGNGRNATSTGGDTPTTITASNAAINNRLSTVEAVPAFAVSGNLGNVFPSAAWTVFVVCRWTQVAGSDFAGISSNRLCIGSFGADFGIMLQPSGLYAASRDAGGTIVKTTALALSVNTWAILCLTHTGSALTLKRYVSGGNTSVTVASTAMTSGTKAATSLRFGAHSTGGGFYGNHAEVRTYDQAMPTGDSDVIMSGMATYFGL